MGNGFAAFSYCNVDILISMITSMRMRWAGHVACMEEEECI
jgi:hypothetical protein